MVYISCNSGMGRAKYVTYYLQRCSLVSIAVKFVFECVFHVYLKLLIVVYKKDILSRVYKACKCKTDF